MNCNTVFGRIVFDVGGYVTDQTVKHWLRPRLYSMASSESLIVSK
jgi:hypothetical protein